MIDLLIINSPLFREVNILYDEDSLPPIGLGYIATMVGNAGLSVRLIDAVAERVSLDQLKKLIKAEKPKAIGINIFTTNYNLVRELIESIDNEECHIIIGGLSTKTLYKYIFDWKFNGVIDIIFGDGELIICDLLLKKEKQLSYETKGKKRFFKIDSKSIYYCSDISNLPLERTYFKNEPQIHPKGFTEAHIVTSRGCIYNCSFCAAARSLNKDLSVRERNKESLIKELKTIFNEYPIVNSIRVLDDLFLKDTKSIVKAIEIFSQFPFQWRAMAHIMTFNDMDIKDLLRLRESGCTEVFIGVESGSPRVLKKIHKVYDINKIQRNLFKIFDANIGLKAYFIYGFPDETEEDFDLTYKLAYNLKNRADQLKTKFRTSVFQFRPYHGTEIYHSLKEKGVIINDVLQVKGDDTLSSLVGRLQFNFHSGNYSKAPLSVVRKYIHQTANLTSAQDWGI